MAHLPTWLVVAAERAVSRAMGGSCSMPLAAHAVWQGDTLQLEAAWGDAEPAAGASPPLVRAHGQQKVTSLEQAERLGAAVAQQLRDGGARGPSAPA